MTILCFGGRWKEEGIDGELRCDHGHNCWIPGYSLTKFVCASATCSAPSVATTRNQAAHVDRTRDHFIVIKHFQIRYVVTEQSAFKGSGFFAPLTAVSDVRDSIPLPLWLREQA